NAYGNLDPRTTTASVPTVSEACTTTTVNSSLHPSFVSQNVTFTATVDSSTSVPGPPTGTITFKDSFNGGPINTITCTGGSQTLSSGVAKSAPWRQAIT